MPLQLSDAMFLCPAMAKVISDIRNEHRLALELAEELNVFGNRQLFATHVQKNNLQQVLVSSLLPRLLTAFQASVLTGERGLSAETKLLTRKVLEVTFRIVAIAKSEEVAKKYLQSDEQNRKKFLNKLRLLKTVKNTPEEVAKIDALHADATAKIVADDIKDLSIHWYADQACLLDMYNTAYAFLSESAHANVRDLVNLLETGEDGDIEALRYGPDPEALSDDLSIGIESVILSLEAAFALLPGADTEELKRLREKMTSLFSELDKRET